MTRRSIVVVRGTGSIGTRHIATLQSLGHVALAFPVRTDRPGDVRSFSEAAERGATHAVIATSTGRHLADASAGVRAGLHVMIEKPVAPTDEGVQELEVLASDHDRKVSVAYCLRFQPSLTAFRARLPSIGDVHAVTARCQSYLPGWRPDRDHREGYAANAHEGGALRDLSHEVDYAQWLFGGPSTGVFAVLSSTGRLQIDAEEAADLLWTTARGATIHVRLDYLTHQTRRTMLAQGSEGEIEWDAVAGTVRLRRRDGSDEVDRFEPDRDAMMRAQATAFLAGAPDDRICDLAAAREVVQTCERARRSSSEGKRI